MRKLLLLPVFLLLALLFAAGPAQALSLPPVPALRAALPDEEAEEDEAEEAGGESEGCESDSEEGEEACDKAEEAVEEQAVAEECVIEDAIATVAASPGNGTVRLTIHYRAFTPAAVAIDARLRGAKGSLHLGSSHTRFRRNGVFHDSFGLSKKKMERALAAREYAIELHAVNTPGYCRMHLSAQRGAARKLVWS
jgi:hypothetical protein